LYQFLLYEVGTVLELYKQNANFTCRVIDCVAKHSRTFLFFSLFPGYSNFFNVWKIKLMDSVILESDATCNVVQFCSFLGFVFWKHHQSPCLVRLSNTPFTKIRNILDFFRVLRCYVAG